MSVDSDLIFVIKQGTTNPSLLRQLLDNDGSVVDLTGATVRITMVSKDGTVLINAAVCTTFNDPTTGWWVQYDWSSSDTAVAGYHKAELEVEYSPGQTEIFPNSSYLQVKILEHL